MHQVILEPQFLPPIEYFTQLLTAETVIMDVHHHYEKQTYRNRCLIRGANKVERLTVPVKAGNKTPFHEVKINYEQDWVKTFWRSIKSAYANAPFFIYYEEDFQKIFFKKPELLLDLNLQLLTLCLRLLNLKVNIKLSQHYEKKLTADIKDLRSVISPKQSFSERSFYKPWAYPQLFGANFEANLSVIDLIFCEGPNAPGIVTRSSKTE